jgi:hypothetical protein
MSTELTERARVEVSDKRVATARARAALAGAELHVIEGDDGCPEWIVTREAVTSKLQSLDDVERWLEHFAASRALERAA